VTSVNSIGPEGRGASGVGVGVCDTVCEAAPISRGASDDCGEFWQPMKKRTVIKREVIAKDSFHIRIVERICVFEFLAPAALLKKEQSADPRTHTK